jgi:hypothetical protein
MIQFNIINDWNWILYILLDCNIFIIYQCKSFIVFKQYRVCLNRVKKVLTFLPYASKARVASPRRLAMGLVRAGLRPMPHSKKETDRRISNYFRFLFHIYLSRWLLKIIGLVFILLNQSKIDLVIILNSWDPLTHPFI